MQTKGAPVPPRGQRGQQALADCTFKSVSWPLTSHAAVGTQPIEACRVAGAHSCTAGAAGPTRLSPCPCPVGITTLMFMSAARATMCCTVRPACTTSAPTNSFTFLTPHSAAARSGEVLCGCASACLHSRAAVGQQQACSGTQLAAAGHCMHTHTPCMLNCSCLFPACPLGRLPKSACPPHEERLLCQAVQAVLSKDEVHVTHVHRLACHDGDTKLHKILQAGGGGGTHVVSAAGGGGVGQLARWQAAAGSQDSRPGQLRSRLPLVNAGQRSFDLNVMGNRKRGPPAHVAIGALEWRCRQRGDSGSGILSGGQREQERPQLLAAVSGFVGVVEELLQVVCMRKRRRRRETLMSCCLHLQQHLLADVEIVDRCRLPFAMQGSKAADRGRRLLHFASLAILVGNAGLLAMQTSLAMQAFKACLGVDHLHRAALGHILDVRADPDRHPEAKRPHLVQLAVHVVLAETGEWYGGLARRIDSHVFTTHLLAAAATAATLCQHRLVAARRWPGKQSMATAQRLGRAGGCRRVHGETSFN